MEFATTNLREKLLHELQEAKSVKIAVAYFSPEQNVLAALQQVPRLRLLVAKDFQVNNPDSLESLSKRRHWVRAVSAEEHGGNLHSKVYLIRRKDNSLWAMVGSANLTRPGLTSNQEACVIFDSRQEEDEAALFGIRAWLDELFSQDYPAIDFDLARAVFETRNKGNARRSASERGGRQASRYWAVKPGYCGEYWLHFLAEEVVAIGWEDMGDPSKMTHQQAIAAYRATWPDEKDRAVSGNVAQILHFHRR